MTSDGALAGIRVLDLSTGVAGPVAAMLLADHGADVIKAEPPGGDPARSRPGFAVWNRGKRGIVLDYRSPAGRARLAGLLAGADLCVVSDEGTALAGTAADPLAVTAEHPGLVYLHVPPYLTDAPWAGGRESHPLLAAASGVAMRQSSYSGGPVELVSPHLLYGQAIWAAACGVAALLERRHSGAGQLVTVAGVHATLLTSSGLLPMDPDGPPQSTANGPGGPNPCYTRYRCADGEWLFLAALTPKFQRRAFETLGLDDVPADQRIAGHLERLLLPENRGWVTERLAARFASRDRDTWLSALAAADCPAGPLGQRDAWLDHPQVEAIGMRVVLDDPQRGRVVMPGVPLVLTRTPGVVRSPAPAPGQHGRAGEEWDARPVAPGGGQPGNGLRRSGPLAGYRVLDLGTILAGPYAGMLLAELGADVVKVEPPAGDSFRERGFAYNRGMRCAALDLRDPRGREAFGALVRHADVVIDNYRPGVLDRLGVGYDALTAINPAIVTLSNTGYGEGGPLGSKPGFDPILQGLSGMMTAQGGDDEPVFNTIAVNDVTAAALLALGSCLALHHRERTGQGQRAWVSLAGVAAFLQSGELVRYPGRPPAARGGRDHPGPGPLDRYFRAGDGWVRVCASVRDVAALRDTGLLAAGHRGQVADGRGLGAGSGIRGHGAGTGSPHAGEAGNPVSEAELGSALAAAIAGLSRDEAVRRLTAAGVPAAPARRFEELIATPEWEALEIVHRHKRPGGTSYVTAGRFAWFSRTQQHARLAAPGLGEHSRDVLAEAGLSAAVVERLIGDGVVVEGPPLIPQPFAGYR